MAVSVILYTFAAAMRKKATTVERILLESNLRQSIENGLEAEDQLSDMERKDYEAQIAQLNETIRQSNEFINRLMDQLKEQGQKAERAERRIEELMDEVRELNKRIKDLVDRDKRHNKMSMGKKSFKKHNRVESKQSRQEEKDDYDNSDAKKDGNSDSEVSSNVDSDSKGGDIDKTKVTSEYLDQKRSERGKYNTMQAAKVTKLGHYFKKYVWVLVNRAANVVYFLYDNDENDSRGRRPIEKFLDKAMKALQSDGYTVYKQLTKDMPECEHVLCWAHVRAKFHLSKEVSKDEYAAWFEDQINKLYLIESQLIMDHATPDEIRKRRQEKDVTDILTSLWCEAQRLLKQKKPRYGEMMRTALNYMCNGWDELCNYRNDGHYTIDNMVAERAIRPFTVKRKGSMFYSSEKGIKNAMIFHTLIETCKRCGIMVKDYLTYVLSELNRGNKDYASLIPSAVALK